MVENLVKYILTNKYKRSNRKRKTGVGGGKRKETD